MACLFCFNIDDNTGSRSGRQKTDILRRFFTLVERYFEEKTGSNDDRLRRKEIPRFAPVPENLKVASCVECFSIVDSYCDTYHKMKCLELELDKLLYKIKAVMSCADKEPSKIDQIAGWSRAEKRKLEESMEFRRIFQNHCELGSMELFPKLRINRDRSVPKGRKRHSQKNTAKPASKASRGGRKVSSKPPSAKCDIVPTPAANALDTTGQELRGEQIKLEVIPPESPNPDHFESEWLPEMEMSPGDDDSVDADWVADFDELSHADDNNEVQAKKRKTEEVSDYETDGDSDWVAEDNKKKGRRKTKAKLPQKRSGRPPRLRIRNRSKKPKSGPIECRKCNTEPLPIFPSTDALQVHQNYLHSKGYVPLVKADVVDTLHLTVENLRLIEVDTTIRRCSDRYPDCPKEFMLDVELLNHQKRHDSFACESCGVVINDAVDYILHEMEHLKEANGQDTDVFTCGKCPAYSTLLEGELINHCLEFHMGKPVIQASCPICLQQFQYRDKVPFLHYINYHDLTRLEDPLSTGISCLEEGCSAYFLTEDQLQHHWSTIHGKAPKSKLAKSDENKSYVLKQKLKRRYLKYQKRECEHSCEFCPKKFRGIRELREHTWSKHSEQKSGGDCGAILLTDEGLTIEEFATESKEVCDICDKVLTSKWQLECHQQHHGEFKCEFCDEVKTLASELAVHETVHKIVTTDNNESNVPMIGGNVNCARCNYTTTKRLDYIDHHLESHLGLSSDRKRCPICKKSAPNLVKGHKGKNSLKNWMVRHYMENHDRTDLDPEKIPRCTSCPAYFRTPVQLHDHSREVHGKHTVRECCDCGKFFAKGDHLKSHRASVHKIDESTFQFVCSFPECGYKFERQIELDYHEHNAHNEKDVGMLMCPECGKKCIGKGQLAVHIRSHATLAKKLAERQAIKERKIEVPMCDQCGKTFGNRRLLNAHVKRHLGQEGWKFLCPMCPKKCPDKTKLNEHIRMHTKDKPCICEMCGAAHSTSKGLRLHRKRVHADIIDIKVLPKVKLHN